MLKWCLNMCCAIIAECVLYFRDCLPKSHVEFIPKEYAHSCQYRTVYDKKITFMFIWLEIVYVNRHSLLNKLPPGCS
jgi:hypothetical protein